MILNFNVSGTIYPIKITEADRVSKIRAKLQPLLNESNPDNLIIEKVPVLGIFEHYRMFEFDYRNGSIIRVERRIPNTRNSR